MTQTSATQRSNQTADKNEIRPFRVSFPETELAELRHAAAPPVPVPALPLPVANTSPIRLVDGVLGTRLPNSTGPAVPAPEEMHGTVGVDGRHSGDQRAQASGDCEPVGE